MKSPVFIIGIDLGTTNSVVAYTLADADPTESPTIHSFPITQYIGPGEQSKRAMLPSFLLVPGAHAETVDYTTLPWDGQRRMIVGEYARDRGAELPSHAVSSAKSWLCNTMVDRNTPILPWEGPDPKAKLSPVEASAALLNHIRSVWDEEMAADDPARKMEFQEILITVPASFDAVARELTVKAAQLAGLENITLLEEPQAALYAWIDAAGERWRQQVKVDDRILVCDVGGGTCDFSLIRVYDQEGALGLERVAVGNHLLVGGDNMDLTLAYAIHHRMAEQGTPLDDWQLRGLRLSCRAAKEKLLDKNGSERHPITILGRGSRLIGGTLSTELTRQEVDTVILDGFFPFCEPSAAPRTNTTAGLREVGLSYESDPGVTRHLAQFLKAHNQDAARGDILPDAILFNGGVMKSAALRQRLLEVLASWKDRDRITLSRPLDNDEFDLAVARGAVYYGLSRRGRGVRIRSGMGQSYYLGIAASLPAVPGMPPPIKALCVAPFGMEEGTRERLDQQEFVLVVGEPVNFDFLGSSVRHDDGVGTLVEAWEGEIQKITTLETTLDGEIGSTIPVTVEIYATEVGTLELWCVSNLDQRRWKLEFNVREESGA